MSFPDLPRELQLKIIHKARRSEARLKHNWDRARHVLADRIPIVQRIVFNIPGIPLHESESCYNKQRTFDSLEVPAYMYILQQDAERLGLLKPGYKKQLLSIDELYDRAVQLGATGNPADNILGPFERMSWTDQATFERFGGKWPTRPGQVFALLKRQRASLFACTATGRATRQRIPHRPGKEFTWS
jgi:hypothetical protein